MKVLVVGYGSMGRRRIRLYKQLDKDAQFICVDSNTNRIKQIKDDGYNAFVDLSDALKEKIDFAFVCTSPLSHAAIIPILLQNKINTFTEINLSSINYDLMIKLAKENDVKIFLSSTMLYKNQIKKINELVQKETQPLSYIYHIGQYLPDWHPWESYKDFFVGKKESNGCREIYAIQLPWIVDTFGEIVKLNSVSQKSTNLEIDYDDSYITTFEHKNGNKGVFVVDVVSRIATTYLEIIGENIHITWDGSNDGLKIYNIAEKKVESFTAYENLQHNDNYAVNIVENTYLDEIKDFISYVKNNTEPKWSIQKDLYVLNLIDKIEKK
ncbi:MAG: Gfo/Idh/MocA family oxidoreductase [Spirochaetales bacterium]|nr:Gfo/Idh/MocA family oxidoreductase [Spirochaetales bacterium]